MKDEGSRPRLFKGDASINPNRSIPEASMAHSNGITGLPPVGGAILTFGMAIGLAACSSPTHTRTVTPAPIEQQVMVERPVVPTEQTSAVAERPMPPDRIVPRAGTGTTTVAPVCSTHFDAQGNRIYDDPLCPTRDRQAIETTHDVQEPAYYDRHINSALDHVRRAEVAGDQGNIPDMLRHTDLALSQATAAQRAVDDASLNDGIMDLRETMILGQRNHIAPAALRDARVKLTQAAHVHPVGARTGTVTGELRRTSTPAAADGGQYYVVRDRQRGDTPVILPPDLSRQVKDGDVEEMQLDAQGRVLAISKYP